MRIVYNNPRIVEDGGGNYLNTKETEEEISFTFYYISEAEKRAAQAQSGTSVVSLLLAFGLSTFIQIAFGGKIEATWLLFGCVQLMSLIPLFNLNLPANFREFSKNLAILHGEPEFLPNIFESYMSKDHLDPYNEYFTLMSKFRAKNIF